MNSSLVAIHGFVVGSDMWFEPRTGLNIIYGKNGVGKSTIINFISAFSSRQLGLLDWYDKGKSEAIQRQTIRSGAERGDGRLLVKFIAPEVVAIADNFANVIRDDTRIKPDSMDSSFGLDWKRSSSSSVVRNLTKQLSDDLVWTDELVYEGLKRHIYPEIDVQKILESQLDELTSEDEQVDFLLMQVTKQILQGKLDPSPVQRLSDSLRRTLLFHYLEWSPESSTVSSINHRLATYGIDQSLETEEMAVSRNLLDSLDFVELFLLFVDVVICRLQYELNDVIVDVDMWFGDEHGRLSDFNDENPLTYSSVHNDADEIIGIVARAVYEQRSSPLVSYEDDHRVVYEGPIRLIFQTSGVEGVGEHTAVLEERRCLWNEGFGNKDSTFEQQVRSSWLYDSRVLHSERLDTGGLFTEQLPFYELKIALGESSAVPFDAFRLDDNLDIEQLVAEVAVVTLNKELFEALAVLDENELEDGQLSEFIQPLSTVFEPVSQLVASLGIGIDGIRVEVSRDIGDWALGKGIKLWFTSALADVTFERLSTAQQYWVKAGILLVAAQNADTRVLVIADEPDRSLHERAANNVMEVLANSGLDVIVSSHSVAALRTRNATLHHLEVGPDRRRTVSEVAVGEDVLVAAERFGTTPYDLLSLKRMMVLVEGAHDAAVVSRVMELSENRLLSDRVLVAPMRGVKNVVSAADSVLVTEFSELNLLVVVDNGRNELFTPILAELRERESAGASEKELKKILTSHRMDQHASYEERMLFDLLERAIHRGILRRLDLFALSVGDVIELLPAAGFGASIGWKELRQQYQMSGLRMDFKTWLRETHQISVSVRTVEKAFDHSDSLHPELIRLLQQIELGCSV